MQESSVRKRIVVTLAFGPQRFSEMALGLGRSLRLIGDPHRRVVITNDRSTNFSPAFDEVIYTDFPAEDIWWAKFYALDLTDAEQILFLDGDSLAFQRLEPVFDFFDGAPFGVQGQYLETGHWYGATIESAAAAGGVPGLVQFNGGLLYYERTKEAHQILAAAKAISREAGRYGWENSRGVPADEVCLSMAMAQTGLGRVAPDDLDFHNSATGLIGKLHMDVRRGQCEYLCRRYKVRFVRPFVFHASFYGNFLIYWRQLAWLARLERYELTHEFGAFSKWHKLQRSVQRRVLKWWGKI